MESQTRPKGVHPHIHSWSNVGSPRKFLGGTHMYNTYVAVPVHSTPSGHLGNTVHTHTWTTFEQAF